MKKEMIEKNTNKKGPLVTNFSDENGWSQWEGNWYFNINGVMQSNYWEHDPNNGLWYYMGSNGAMVTNQWVQDKGQWYYMGSSGAMVTDQWQQDKGQWYYLGSNGAMVTDQWVEDNGKSYYLGSNGAMVTNSNNNSNTAESFCENVLSVFGFKYVAVQQFYANYFGAYTVTASFGQSISSGGSGYVTTVTNGVPSISASIFDGYDISFNGQNVFATVCENIGNGKIKIGIGINTLKLTIASDSVGASIIIKIIRSNNDDDDIYSAAFGNILGSANSVVSATQIAFPTSNTVITRGIQGINDGEAADEVTEYIDEGLGSFGF